MSSSDEGVSVGRYQPTSELWINIKFIIFAFALGIIFTMRTITVLKKKQ